MSALASFMEEGGPDVRLLNLAGGEALFEAGQATDLVYMARAGRLAALAPEIGGEPRWLGVIGPGEPIGELAALTDSPHAATVVALRDCELLAMPRRTFLAGLESHPAVLLEMARLLVRRARGERAFLRNASVFALIALSPGKAMRAFAERLAHSLRAWTARVLVLGAEAADRSVEWFSRAEEDHGLVIYCAEADEAAWALTCARQADRLLLVGRAGGQPRAWSGSSLKTQLVKPWDLILMREEPRPPEAVAEAWRKIVGPRRLLHVRDDDASDCSRVGRLLAGRSVGLVLSGGGARGYAHVGAVRALRRAGAPIDLVGGTSMGAVIGAGVAMGWDDAEIEERVRRAFVVSSPISDLTFPLLAMSRGEEVARRLDAHFGDTDIGDLRLPFFCVSSNLTQGVHEVHATGPLARALRASIALPGILPPVVAAGEVLVDGGVLRNLPTDLMRGLHDGPVVAVDVGTQRGLTAVDLQTPKPVWKWLFSGGWRRGPPIVSVLLRAATVTAARELALARRAADLLVTPQLERVEIRDWKAFAPAVAAGESAMREALTKLDRPITELRRHVEAP